jgi:hypothetical protein
MSEIVWFGFGFEIYWNCGDFFNLRGFLCKVLEKEVLLDKPVTNKHVQGTILRPNAKPDKTRCYQNTNILYLVLQSIPS